MVELATAFTSSRVPLQVRVACGTCPLTARPMSASRSGGRAGEGTSTSRRGVQAPGKDAVRKFSSKNVSLARAGGKVQSYAPAAAKKAAAPKRPTSRGAAVVKPPVGSQVSLPSDLDEQLFAAFGDKLAAPLEEWLKTPPAGSGGGVGSEEGAGRGEESGGRVGDAARGKGGDGAAGGWEWEGSGLSAKKMLEFERNGHAKVPNLLAQVGMDAGEVHAAFDNVFNARLLEAYTQKLRVFGVDEAMVAKLRDPDEAREVLEELCAEEDREIPFLQIFHLHDGASCVSARVCLCVSVCIHMHMHHIGTSESAQTLRKLAFSPQIGQMAAELLGVKTCIE